jgi:hypothetical protein
VDYQELIMQTMPSERSSSFPLTDAHTHSEGEVAKAIETQTAKVPSDWFLWAAIASMGAAAALQIAHKRSAGLFVGQWAAPFLLFGVYNKIVKTSGSDRTGG